MSIQFKKYILKTKVDKIKDFYKHHKGYKSKIKALGAYK